jgi:mycothiol synthase
MTANVSPSPSVPEGVAALAARARAADGQPPFSDQSLVELARGERELVERGHGAAIVGASPDGSVELELVVEPDARGRGEGAALLETVLARHPGVESAWAHGDHPASRALAARFGFEPVRTLLQLRADVGLDTPPSAALDQRKAADGRVPTERNPSAGRVPAKRVYRDHLRIAPFRPGLDDAAWLDLNARAFANHPEQGGLTLRDLDDRQAEPWFDAADFLLLREGDDLAGFCWLKIEGEVGEFYAVGVDPGRQGEGLGRVLMDAGLARLAERGIRTAALYVEADNAPALALYRRYGFARHTIDVRYRRRD